MARPTGDIQNTTMQAWNKGAVATNLDQGRMTSSRKGKQFQRRKLAMQDIPVFHVKADVIVPANIVNRHRTRLQRFKYLRRRKN
jgi:hypothetical protein